MPFPQDQPDSDELFIIEDEAVETIRRTWKILVVDDDPDVHLATQHALEGTEMLGRFPEFLHAESAADAADLLRRESDIAVILLDVVMETQDAGLGLVDYIRNELGLKMPRIVLRTGHPGYAPELSAIRDYDINDYKTKSELTRNRLFTTVLAAIRAYDQLQRMEASRQGLEQIVRASGELLQNTGLPAFAAGVIRQLTAFIGLAPEALLCAQANLNPRILENTYVVLAAAGNYERFIGHRLDEVEDEKIVTTIQRCLRQRRHLFTPEDLCLHFSLHSHKHFAVYLAAPEPRPEIDEHLLKVFCNNVSICADNIHLIGQLQEAAYHDQLVDLPNRSACVQAIDRCYENPSQRDWCLALIDIDRFAEINNAFGHEYGDQLLKAMAQRLCQQLGADCFIARLAADDFALLGKEAILQPTRLRPLLTQPFQIGNATHALSVTISLVRLRESGPDGCSVLKDASITRKLGRERGLNQDAIFSPLVSDQARERTQLLHRLQEAFERDQLFTVFQPQVDLRSGKVRGMESLLRWRDEVGDLIGPDRFIPLAEQSGLIVQLGDWVLQKSLQSLVQLEREGWRGLRISVNVSAVQFRLPDLVERVESALAEAHLPPQQLELEITESVALGNWDQVEKTLARLRALGIHIALDDFGTGFSSLSYLYHLPLDRIKIDRAFILAMTQEHEGRHLADLIVRLGHSLHLQLIAEGVETETQAARLRAIGCQEAQGFLYGRPMEFPVLRRWLREKYPTGLPKA